MNPMINKFFCALVGLLASGISLATIAAEPQQGVVLAVHSEQSTRAFVADHRLPAGQAEGGRFAVVKLVNGAWGNASYALVYVPARLSVAQNDQVELVPTDTDILKTPGSGVVMRVSHSDRSDR
jgi:hypothetical protein